MVPSLDETPCTNPVNVDRLVQRIRTIHRESRLVLAIDVGHAVVHELYGGDIGVLRKLGRTHDGYRKLSEHSDLPMSKSTLWRYVRVYELASCMQWVVRSSLTVAHLTSVLGLAPDEQERLLRKAEEKGWSSSRLSNEGRGKARSARVSSPVMKVVLRVERLEADPRQFGRVRDLRNEERQRVQDAVARTRTWCEAMEARLRDSGEVN